MSTKVRWLIGLALIACATTSSAQAPLSAIDWLSDSLARPSARQLGDPAADIARSALPADVSVSDIDDPSLDAVGLLPASATGLPKDLWGHSRAGDLAARFQATGDDMLPAMQDLLYTLLLAELDPPFDSGADAKLYLARLDRLLDLGALDQARSLLDLSGQSQPAIFRRAFDVALLTHHENRACDTLRQTPALSPTFPARIFCLARGGDWNAAALSLETGRALGFITEFDQALLARFLDPVLFEGEGRPGIPARPSPLVFRLLDAIGEPMPTANLPRAFAHADLNSNTGWKAQIEAVERLVRSGALDPNRLLGLYSERRPAASGGVWARVATVQQLDQALGRRDSAAVSAALPLAWAQMEKAELEVPFARLFFHRLAALNLMPATSELIFEIAMLTDQYETVAGGPVPPTERHQLLAAIAKGQPGAVFSADPMIAALQDGFRATAVPVRLKSLTSNRRLGEAMLRAMTLFANGARGDLDELTDALAFFRAVGLQDAARRAALQLLILERRG